MKRAPKGNRMERFERTIYIVTLVSFIIPIIFLICRLIVPPVDASDPDMRTRADYVLMLLECLLGVVVIHLPSVFEKRLRFEMPTALSIMYILFLYGAIFLGEVRDFYYRVPYWDTILHALSSVMAGSLGFIVVATLNRDRHVAMNLSPKFVAIFAFCFAVTIGVLWEIYEFSFDGLLGLNMQKFRLADGTVLVGHAALTDTMKDLIVDSLGALVSAAAGYFSIRKNAGWLSEIIEKHKQSVRQ